MNDSNNNNNIFGDNNVTPTPPLNDTTGFNPTPNVDSSFNNVNLTSVGGNDINSVFKTPQTGISQTNQSAMPMQPQNGFNSQMDNHATGFNPTPNVDNSFNNVNPTSVGGNDINSVFKTPQSGISQTNQSAMPIQPQNGVNSQMDNHATGFNPTPNSFNNVNPTSVGGNDINSVFKTPQSGISQTNQSAMPIQPQNGFNSQTDNHATGFNPTPNVDNSFNNVNPTSVGSNDINSVFKTSQPGISQTNQSVMAIQPQNSFNSKTNNDIPNNNISQTPFSPLSTNSINPQPNIQSNQNMNNSVPLQQNNTITNQVDDNELLKAFIGNNYEKITTRSFNIAGFFFTTFYMFYRKMFGYALLVFLLNFIVQNVMKIPVAMLLFNVAVGFLVNKIYLSYAKKKIAIIKASGSQKSLEELKIICSTKGGTSIGKIFLGFITELGIALVLTFILVLIGIGSAIGDLFNINNWKVTTTGNDSKNGTLVENVSTGGYSCFNSKCSVTIYDSNDNSSDYVLSINNTDLFNSLGDYADYIKLNIYYTQKGNEKTIVDYKIYLKTNNEDISSVKTENELRDKIGLYSIGTHTDLFTLTKIGTPGFGFKDNTSYTYTPYTFIDSKNIEYEMKYINDNGALNLVEGNKYNVTFDVTEDTFGYEFTIKTIK